MGNDGCGNDGGVEGERNKDEWIGRQEEVETRGCRVERGWCEEKEQWLYVQLLQRKIGGAVSSTHSVTL